MLAVALADANLFVPEDPAEVQRIRAIADSALSLGPEDAFVLGWMGFALSYLGYPEEAARHSAKAVRKTPGSGFAHYAYGIACCMKNDAQTALVHFDTAVRLSPGWLLLWAVQNWRCIALARLGRWSEALIAINAAMEDVPNVGLVHLLSGLCSSRLGKELAAQKYIANARELGWDSNLMETAFPRLFLNAPSIDDDIATIRALYAAMERRT